MTTTLEPATTGSVTTAATCTELLEWWRIDLASKRRAAATIRIYLGGAARWITWFETTEGREPVAADLTSRNVSRWLAASRTGPPPLSAGTCRARYQAIRQFSKFLVADEDIPADLLAGLAAPQGGQRKVDALTDREVKAMLAACKPPAGASRWTRFEDLRDEACLRLFLDTGLRASECAALTLDDVDLGECTVKVRYGKGGKSRAPVFSDDTAKALGRYLRHARKGHQYEDLPALWLGSPNKPTWNYHGLQQSLGRRARLAAVEGFHVHRLRHTCASSLLAAGMSEGEVMAQLGWSSRMMLDVYSRDTAASRSRVTARRIFAARGRR